MSTRQRSLANCPAMQIAALLLALACGSARAADQGAKTAPPALLADKTLVAWVSPANLTQGGGSVLSIDDQHGRFDGIIFGEIARGKWMAGSDGFRRSQRDQSRSPAETADPQTQVQMAAVYRGRQITLLRNGTVYSQYQVQEPQTFGPGTAWPRRSTAT